MMFCPKCGSLLIPNKKKSASCKNCNFVSKDDVEIKVSETMEVERKIEIVSEGDELKILPITEAECPTCGHQKARFWTAQTRSADEAETKFFRCEKCHHTWREAN